MSFRVSKNAILQYILVYIMILIPGSCLFQVYWGNEKYFVILGLYILLLVAQRKYRVSYGAFFTLILAFLFLGVRLLVGGIGLQVWAQFAVCVLSAQAAISCNPDAFLTRFIKVIVFFSSISIVMWALFMVAPELANIWPAQRYFVQSIGIDQWARDYYGKGLLFYSYLDIHTNRNCGIYTEPGVYQVVLNSALFVLLYWKRRLKLKSERQYLRYVVIILTALVTCASTTGYIGTIIILFIYFVFFRESDFSTGRIKRFIAIAVFIGILILGIDYSVRGEDSLVYIQVIQKLFPSGELDVSEGSGQYRMGMILYALSLIGERPLGVGYDVFNSGLEQGFVAASLVSFAAVFGVISWFVVMILVFYPMIKYARPTICVLFLCIFVNTTLAQTDLLYPTQIMIPLYLVTTHGQMTRGGSKYEDENISVI